MNKCECKKLKPVRMTEESFVGLFDDVPVYVYEMTVCDRCRGVIRDWHVVRLHNDGA